MGPKGTNKRSRGGGGFFGGRRAPNFQGGSRGGAQGFQNNQYRPEYNDMIFECSRKGEAGLVSHSLRW